MIPSIPLFGPLPVGPELLIILLVLVLLFGAQKIPKLARSTGQAMGEFKKGREEVEEELQEMQGEPDSDSESETTESTERTETTDADDVDETEPETESESETTSETSS
ncbi:twin-arginine translocase TatA/TatE family subunit [Halopenitus sp. H-Gu1]|uniref:Sec-independent protein translocase subunit TatA/TatB n=1 Tax=Halopenitus sp. H-Gu1 TaxID=3242697 RepID=UPI00359D14FE